MEIRGFFPFKNPVKKFRLAVQDRERLISEIKLYILP